MILDLAAQIQIHFDNQHTVFVTRESWRSLAIRGSHIAGPVERTKVLVRGFLVARGEFIGEGFRSHPIDRHREVAIRNGRIPGLNAPKRLAEVSHGRRRVEHDLGPIQAEHHPVLGMVAAVADVDGDPAELGLEDRVASISLRE